MTKTLYLPSTPLNLLTSLAVAGTRQSTDSAELWLIDQQLDVDENRYFQALSSWSDAPFQQVKLFTGKAKGLDKLRERKHNFALIKEGIGRFQPDIIAVGSDRRVEFQYAMHLQSKTKPAQGWYLDDGLYSYKGRPHHPIKDGINALLKKLIYGLWWDEPSTVGASRWIEHAWLLKPESAVPALQQKIMHPITTAMLKSDLVQAFSQHIMQKFALDTDSLSQIDDVLIISHPNNQKKLPNYQANLKKQIADLLAQNRQVAIKYHPRQAGLDALTLAEDKRVQIIPAVLAFEFILPLLKQEAVVSGEMSSILMTTQWIRPEISVITQQPVSTEYEDRKQ
jgi:hypothetical protein